MWTWGNNWPPAPRGVSRILRIRCGNWLLHAAALTAFRKPAGCVIVSGLRAAVMQFQAVRLFSLRSVLTTLRGVRRTAQGFMERVSWTNSFHHPTEAPVDQPEILSLSADEKYPSHLATSHYFHSYMKNIACILIKCCRLLLLFKIINFKSSYLLLTSESVVQELKRYSCICSSFPHFRCFSLC